MKQVHCLVIVVLIIALFFNCNKKEGALEETLQKSITWLWKQQGADGGWHSQTHAVLRDGRVLTPYILFHLLPLQEATGLFEKEKIDSAVGFIIREMRSSITEDSSTLTDYPNYSAAYALRVLHKLDRDTALQRIIIHYLLEQQFIEHRGFTPDSLAYGGWGYGEPDLRSGEHGHEDVSHTRRIAEALVESGNMNPVLRSQTFLFLNGAQRSISDMRPYKGCLSRSSLPYDGGFVSSVVTLATNKSTPLFMEDAGYHYPSYATATCDGFLTLHAMKLDTTSAYRDAKSWLIQNQDLSTVDGLDKDGPGQWADVMHYYHFAVRSEAMSIIDPNGKWREQLTSMIINEQTADGFFLNPLGGVNKEDDPLMATIFVIQASMFL